MTKSLLPDLQSPGRVHQHKISISCLAKARVTFLYCHGFGGLSGFTLSGVLATMRVVSGGFWKVGLSYPFTSPSSSIRSLGTRTHTSKYLSETLFWLGQLPALHTIGGGSQESQLGAFVVLSHTSVVSLSLSTCITSCDSSVLGGRLCGCSIRFLAPWPRLPIADVHIPTPTTNFSHNQFSPNQLCN